jgi:hypothetical protein
MGMRVNRNKQSARFMDQMLKDRRALLNDIIERVAQKKKGFHDNLLIKCYGSLNGAQ